ncbi:hypothetical protein [Aeromonas allosaccharophila]|uniref:hypothetical protein n=2 Tax=Aeromonas TaxID=642 RepID=UPI000B1E6899|nr:hypothetical protein [Aeromonas allosaccharophila]
MSAYDFLLQNKLLTLLISVVHIYILCIITRVWYKHRVSEVFSFLLFNFSVIFPSGFFFLFILINPRNVDVFDLISCYLFESLILLLYYCSFLRLRHYLRVVVINDRILVFCLLLLLVLNFPLLWSDGFGLFSSGSRISYLNESPLYKYITYITYLMGCFLAALISASISTKRKISPIVICICAFIFVLTVLSGSKGAFFIWLFQLISLVDYSRVKFRISMLVFFGVFCFSLLSISVVVISDFIGITYEQFADLAFSRFFLVNDARALAFDLRGLLSNVEYSFVSESLRSLSSLFGTYPKLHPLGVHLYENMFGDAADIGANSSFIALAVYFSSPGATISNVLLIGWVPIIIYYFSQVMQTIMQSPTIKIYIYSSLPPLLWIFSQDFLAFQLLIPSVLFLFGLVCVYDFFHIFNKHSSLSVN